MPLMGLPYYLTLFRRSISQTISTKLSSDWSRNYRTANWIVLIVMKLLSVFMAFPNIDFR